jgi:hypothetical protein
MGSSLLPFATPSLGHLKVHHVSTPSASLPVFSCLCFMVPPQSSLEASLSIHIEILVVAVFVSAICRQQIIFLFWKKKMYIQE